MPLIDFHTHAFPDALAPGALDQLVRNTRAYAAVYGDAHPHTDATLAGLAASSRRAGLDTSLVLPIATSPKPSHTLNDFAAAADRYPGLRSFGSVHPRNPDCLAELERVKALGLRGIKLHPEYQGCYADGPETVEVVRKAAELGLWVVFHAGADIGMPPPVHCTPERVVRLRQAAPDARIVLAHFGGYRMWDEVLAHLPEMDVYLDTSYCLPNHSDEKGIFARILHAAGSRRVLFGTDSPWLDQGESLRATRAFLTEAGLSAEEQDAVLGGNAQRILDGGEAE